MDMNLSEGYKKRLTELAGIKNDANVPVDPKIGKEFWFEYHCFESVASCDAHLWLRSHSKIKVIGRGEDENDEFPDEPKVYKIQFEDGFIGDAWEDEIMKSPTEFYRPDPPKK